jgi:hypothetical protein
VRVFAVRERAANSATPGRSVDGWSNRALRRIGEMREVIE